MRRHFIHYVPRRILLRFPQRQDDPWFAKIQGLKDGFTRPMFHTTRRKSGPATQIARGDTVWIVSQMFSPWGALPPALDSRIDVARVVKRVGGGRTFIADRSSCWLPMADAMHVFKSLRTTSADGHTVKLLKNLDKPIGQSLQSLRLLKSGAPLVRWSGKLKKAKLDFISYRIRDGTQAAFETARKLLSKGEAVFWDRWSLPRRLAERREVVSDEALDAYLMKVLRASKQVWGIESEAYFAEGSYSAKEHAAASLLGKYRPVSGLTPKNSRTGDRSGRSKRTASVG